MSSLVKTIHQKFLEELAQEDALSPDQIEALRLLLEEDKKPKVADLEAIFSPAKEADL